MNLRKKSKSSYAALRLLITNLVELKDADHILIGQFTEIKKINKRINIVKKSINMKIKIEIKMKAVIKMIRNTSNLLNRKKKRSITLMPKITTLNIIMVKTMMLIIQWEMCTGISTR